MSFRRTLPVFLLALALAPVVLSAQATATQQAAKPAQLRPDSMEFGRKLTDWFYHSQLDSVVAHMDSASRAQPQSKDQLQQSLLQLAGRAGTEVQVVEEKFITRRGARQYWRTAKFSTLDEPLLIRWVINARGECTGFGLGLLRQAPEIDP